MQFNCMIDWLAYSGKIAIEASDLSERQKKLAKIGIDIATEMLKEIASQKISSTKPYLSFMARDLVRQVAEKCDVRRVVIYPSPKNSTLFILSIEGGMQDAFFDALGCYRFTEREMKEYSVSDDYLKLYGAEIYAR